MVLSERRRVERSVAAAVLHTVALNFKSDPAAEVVAKDLEAALLEPLQGLTKDQEAKLRRRAKRLHELLVQEQLNKDLVKVFIAFALLLKGLQEDGRLPDVIEGSALDRGFTWLTNRLEREINDARWKSGQKQARKLRTLLEREGYFAG